MRGENQYVNNFASTRALIDNHLNAKSETIRDDLKLLEVVLMWAWLAAENNSEQDSRHKTMTIGGISWEKSTPQFVATFSINYNHWIITQAWISQDHLLVSLTDILWSDYFEFIDSGYSNYLWSSSSRRLHLLSIAVWLKAFGPLEKGMEFQFRK